MHLFLMRHGAAEAPIIDDWSRELTAEGKNEVVQSAAWVQAQGASLTHALVSPLTRAQQSFAAANGVLQLERFESSDALIPNAKVSQTLGIIEDMVYTESTGSGMLIVSHMPLVSYLLEAMTFGQHAFLFATGGVAWVDYDPANNRGQLKDFFFPD